MNEREKFLKIAHFELKDVLFLPSCYQWFWRDTLKRWREEGAPPDILYPDQRAQYFGFQRCERIPVISSYYGLGPQGMPPFVPPVVPLFKRQIIHEDLRSKIVLHESGAKCRESKQNPEKMPQWIEFPVKDRKSWQIYKKRLNPNDPRRYPSEWEDMVKRWKKRSYVLGLRLCGFFGIPRSFMGLERLSMMYYDDPKLMFEIGEWLEYFNIEIIKKVTRDIQVDFAYFWEDMAYNKGSLVSPKIVKRFMLSHYKKVTETLRECGVDVVLVDSDGDTTELIPLWIEGGINGQYPLEVAAGMDAVKLRKKYGKNFILMGNIDKRALAKSKITIKEEVMNKVPFLLSQGGYFLMVDHYVPPDVPWENYKYFLELLKNLA